MPEVIEAHWIETYNKLGQLKSSLPFWFRKPSANAWLDKNSAINLIISTFSELNGLSKGIGLNTVDFRKWLKKIKEIFGTVDLEDFKRQEELVFLISECNFEFDKMHGQCVQKIEQKLKLVR